jgi:putative hemolysin
MGVLLIGSGFFSGSETALFNLSRGEIFRLRRTHEGLGGAIAALLARPQRLLNTLLLGNMLVNVAYAGAAAMLTLDLAAAGAPGWHVGAASLVPLLMLILIGEVTPKMIAFRISQRWALATVMPVALAVRALAPIVWLLEKLLVTPITRVLVPPRAQPGAITADELSSLVGLSQRRGLIGPDTGEMLQEIVHLADLRAADIMVPRVDLVAFDVDGDRGELEGLYRSTHLRKIPAYEGDLDGVLGVLHRKSVLLNPEAPLRELVRRVTFVPEAARAEKLLDHFRRTRSQLTIVVDEYGGTAGLVTLEDVLEEIVGDIPDSEGVEASPPAEPVGDGEYVIDGALAIHEWADAFGENIAAERITTIGGFVTSLLGRMPRVGDAADYRNLRFVVESLRGRRIGRLRVCLQGEGP